MAGEKRGSALEGIVFRALNRKRVRRCYNLSNLLWDSPHEDLRWNPDFFLEPARVSSNPPLLVFVTYAGSETDSRQKFWRNLAELFDAQSKFPNLVSVAVVGGARFRNKQFETQKLVFDAVIDLQELIDTPSLRTYLDQIGNYNDRSDLEQKLLRLEGEDQRFSDLIEVISTKIPLRAASHCLDKSFWQVSRASLAPLNVPVSHYRRGVAKSALLNTSDRRAFRRGKQVNERPEHSALLRYGSLAKSIGGLRLVDDEIHFALQNFPEERLGALLAQGITASGNDSIKVLKDVPVLEAGALACASNWERLRNETSLELELSGRGTIPLHGSQIFRSLKALLAFKLGRQGQEWIEDVVDDTSEMRSILVGLIFPKFERGEMFPEPNIVGAIARSLASRCSSITPPSIEEIEKIIDGMIRKEIEAKLVCHGIDPLKQMIIQAADENGVPYESGYMPSGLSECLGFSRKDLGTTGLFIGREQSCFVHWKTVSPQGRDHKVKELFARAYQSRAEYAGEKFILREKPKKVVLFCDGEWREEQPLLLVDGGWSEVLGAGEIHNYVSSFRD